MSVDSVTPQVRLQQVCKTYGQPPAAVQALSNVSLSVAPGEMLALLGRSGSGKSTLLNLLGAIDRPTAGSITVDGQDLTVLAPGQQGLFRRRRIGFVFQSFHLISSLNVFDNVAVPFMLDGRFDGPNRQRVGEILERVGLVDTAQRYTDQLSGGQQQRVAVARAVVHRPALLLADEPTGNLDFQTGEDIIDLLDELRREHGTTLIVATHSTQVAQRCDRGIVLVDGKLDHTTNALATTSL